MPNKTCVIAPVHLKACVHVPASVLTCVCVPVKDLARYVCLLWDVCVRVFSHRLWGVWLLLCCQVGCCCLAWLRGSFNVHWSRISNCSQRQLSSVPVMGDAATWHPPVCCTESLLATTHTACMHACMHACAHTHMHASFALGSGFHSTVPNFFVVQQKCH